MLRLSMIVAFLACSIPIFAETYTAAEVAKHVGEQATVCGKVVSERTATSSRGAPMFINLDAPYPNQVFTILIWQENRAHIGPLPAQGARVCATGLIRSYRAAPEIEVTSKSQLSH
jgi:hypothetical protein